MVATTLSSSPVKVTTASLPSNVTLAVPLFTGSCVPEETALKSIPSAFTVTSIGVVTFSVEVVAFSLLLSLSRISCIFASVSWLTLELDSSLRISSGSPIMLLMGSPGSTLMSLSVPPAPFPVLMFSSIILLELVGTFNVTMGVGGLELIDEERISFLIGLSTTPITISFLSMTTKFSIDFVFFRFTFFVSLCAYEFVTVTSFPI